MITPDSSLVSGVTGDQMSESKAQLISSSNKVSNWSNESHFRILTLVSDCKKEKPTKNPQTQANLSRIDLDIADIKMKRKII